MRIIDGKTIANQILATTKTHLPLGIKAVIVRANNDEASAKYVQKKLTKAQELGVKLDLIELPQTTTTTELKSLIDSLNKSADVAGIIVQLPLFDHLEPSRGEILDVIAPQKDIDGLNSQTLGRAASGRGDVYPATVGGIVECLKFAYSDGKYVFDTKDTLFADWLKGKDVLIVNHSDLIGKPLASLLLKYDATVTVCHQFTKDLQLKMLAADIVVTATGKTQLFDHTWFKQGAVVIDCTSVGTPTGAQGDVIMSPELESKVAWLTPVPGGLGPVTVAYLFWNLVNLNKH